MTIDKTVQDGAVLLAPVGRLDTNSSSALEEAINSAAPDTKKLVLDLSGLDYISSSGLRVLLMGHKLMASSGGCMRVRGVCGSIADVFEITGFDTVLEIE